MARLETMKRNGRSDPRLWRLALMWMCATLLVSLTACRSTTPPSAPPPIEPAVAEVDPPTRAPGAEPRSNVDRRSATKRPEHPSGKPSRHRAGKKTDAEPTYSERGLASWYGPGFHGRRTANGERFDMQAVSAAHKTLPFDTMVRVHNLDNGRSIDVRINDRGPFIKGRIIDLSKGAARKLDLVRAGVAQVEIEVLRWPKHLAGRRIDPSHRVVQVAAFRDPAKARALAESLRRDPAFKKVEVQPAKPWHRVRVLEVTLGMVSDVVERLQRRGFEPLVLRP